LSGFAIWSYLSAHYCFGNGYLFYLYFVVKNTAARYHLNLKWHRLTWATVCCTGSLIVTKRELKAVIR